MTLLVETIEKSRVGHSESVLSTTKNSQEVVGLLWKREFS